MILFLDFDGVLHPNSVWQTSKGLQLDCDGHNLFEHAELLAVILHDLPHVKIVLSTSWVSTITYNYAKSVLPPALQERIIDSTFQKGQNEYIWNKMTRYEQIAQFTRRHQIKEWLALDDNDFRWPERKRHRLIHCNEYGGLGGTIGAVDALRTALELSVIE
jgi:hypothetical protein